jgi:hypothetical protein
VTHITEPCALLAYTEPILSEKQFRERARTELRQIGAQLKGIATDREVYRKLEHEIVERNPQLQARNAFLDMVRGCYADGMTARVLRLLEPPTGDASLPRILAQLADYPELLHERVTQRELAHDAGALARAATHLRSLPLSPAAHHERTVSALASTHRTLDAALDLMLTTAQTYYWIVADSYLDLETGNAEETLSIFQFPWAAPALAE